MPRTSRNAELETAQDREAKCSTSLGNISFTSLFYPVEVKMLYEEGNEGGQENYVIAEHYL